ncbi:ASCH domain-containing protein [Shewanella cyperi]|uniref:N(4)-acetylcytidine amidohydrolase n=1 Tax=Shewanella cyperi TaxID=2814292 RepID=A0A974XW69_9GAMM|nr:N(4)-acetylcytidine aminohydrolase [Shewanella cyperi]QSX31404.1 ASCH domain-containing protein [Shewanella cyperi]
MTPMSSISFFERFEADILSGRKTITLRDESESGLVPGQELPVVTFEQGRWFCDIRILAVTPLAFSELDEEHARAENMSLPELKLLIGEIYPGLEQLYLIRFELLKG